MNRQEQIKEMALLMAKTEKDGCCNYFCKGSCKDERKLYCTYYRSASNLSELGYGNLKTFFQELYQKIDAADCQITIDVHDVQKIAKKYGYNIGD